MHLNASSRAGLAVAVAALLGPVATAAATTLPLRTVRASVAPDGSGTDGGSANPVLSTTGRVLAFDSTATNLAGADPNGPVRDVVAIDLATNERRLVSESPDGIGADGASFSPAMSRDGQRIVFVSVAGNLVAGDTNGAPDVFVRDGRGAVARVSAARDSTEADASSYQPDVSADGRFVVFTSDASNLVPGDTNGRPDVFVRDLLTGIVQRISVASDGAQGNARSSSPAISADGRSVAFESAASNLVPRDDNGVSDVFVRDLLAGRTERASVSATGGQQDKSVQPPFVQQPDISADGRFVVFDSDAATLTKGDLNEHTDVFLRDRTKRATQLVSASSLQVQGNNDTFSPRITPNGRFVTFESFATNLAPADGPREDIFVRDLKQGTTSVVNATADGAPRRGELVPQLLQRPSLSNSGQVAAFSSTAPNLVGGDVNQAEDVFVRLLDPPKGSIAAKPKGGRAGTVKVRVDDPLATSFICQIDANDPFVCGRSIRVRRHAGRQLTVRVGGAGMLFAPELLRVSLSTLPSGR